MIKSTGDPFCTATILGGAALHPKTMGQTNNETCNSDLSAQNNIWQPQPPFCRHFQHNTNGDDVTGDQTAWRNQTPALRTHPQHGTASCKCTHGTIKKVAPPKTADNAAHKSRVTPPLPMPHPRLPPLPHKKNPIHCPPHIPPLSKHRAAQSAWRAGRAGTPSQKCNFGSKPRADTC